MIRKHDSESVLFRKGMHPGEKVNLQNLGDDLGVRRYGIDVLEGVYESLYRPLTLTGACVIRETRSQFPQFSLEFGSGPHAQNLDTRAAAITDELSRTDTPYAPCET